GQWDWRGVPALPPELMFLPSWFPLNIYDFASWARATIVPLLIILTERPVCPIPERARIDELYPAGRKRADYALPKPMNMLSWKGFFHAADAVLRRYDRVAIKWLREAGYRAAERWAGQVRKSHVNSSLRAAKIPPRRLFAWRRH